MSRTRPSKKINSATAAVTGVIGSFTITPIIPASSGYVFALKGITAVNQEAGVRSITLYDGWEEICPAIPLAASGSLIMDGDDLGDGEYELSRSSGLHGSINLAGTVNVTAKYVKYDERTPITKNAARFATYRSAVNTIRTPNRFGGQTEG